MLCIDRAQLSYRCMGAIGISCKQHTLACLAALAPSIDGASEIVFAPLHAVLFHLMCFTGKCFEECCVLNSMRKQAQPV